MGWLWGANEPKAKPSTSNSNNDPTRELDPSLRDFLQTDSPSAAPSSLPPPSEHKSVSGPSSSTPNSLPDALSSSSTSTSTSTPAPPMVYPDGRYADLWSSYRPLGVVEAEAKSDQEKLADVLDTYKARKALIGRAALENCSLEHGDWNECLRTGTWMQRITMCRTENKAFERCYVMQAKFLRALGYLSSPRPDFVEEQIQMHADTLYHRMLAQEAAVAAAKASNAPIPTFPPIMPPSFSSGQFSSAASPLSSPSSTTTPSSPSHQEAPPPPPQEPYAHPQPIENFSKDHLTPAAREAFEKRLKELSPEARELEERAVAMEASQTDVVARTMEKIVEESDQKRRERREKGEGGVGDWISYLLGR